MFLSMTSSESYKNNGFLHMRHAGPLINKNTNTDINNDNGSNTLNIYINTTYSF